jgi:hypothetical protein
MVLAEGEIHSKSDFYSHRSIHKKDISSVLSGSIADSETFYLLFAMKNSHGENFVDEID